MNTHITIIDTMTAILENHTTQQLLEVAQECQRRDDETFCVNTRLIKYAAIGIIEERNPAVVPGMTAWADDMNKTTKYVDQLAVELAQIGTIK